MDEDDEEEEQIEVQATTATNDVHITQVEPNNNDHPNADDNNDPRPQQNAEPISSPKIYGSATQ